MRSPKQPILYQNKLKIPEKFLRFATPEVVALYRAEKLKCERLVEIGAGIGGQTLAFSKFCKKVLAIETNKESVKILINNLKKLDIKNVEVFAGDALSKKAIEKIKEFSPKIIFCDTERPEKSERTLEQIKPSPKKILESFSNVTSKIAIEIPPFTKDLEKLDYEYEKEFLSSNKQLNRLTLYFNELANSEVSAISLPSKEKIIYKKTKSEKTDSAKDYKYIYSIDPTIIVADLTNELAEKFNSKILGLNKLVLISNENINSNFLTKHKILSVCKNNQEEILENLKKLDAKKVELHYKIEPKDYWKVRNIYENQLNGNKEVSLFINNSKDEAILTEN